MKVHQDIVDVFMEDVVLDGLDLLSEEEARNYIVDIAKKLDEIAEEELRTGQVFFISLQVVIQKNFFYNQFLILLKIRCLIFDWGQNYI